MSIKEKKLIDKTIILAKKNNATLWRNQSGMCYQGIKSQMASGNIQLKHPRAMMSGLAKGASDLIGFREVVITPEMVGQKVAVFMAVECKTENVHLTDLQKEFLAKITDAGGQALEVREGDDINAKFVQQKLF